MNKYTNTEHALYPGWDKKGSPKTPEGNLQFFHLYKAAKAQEAPETKGQITPEKKGPKKAVRIRQPEAEKAYKKELNTGNANDDEMLFTMDF